jgi:purine-binding chemotaxis protein CheW
MNRLTDKRDSVSDTTTDEESVQYLTFFVGGERYAIAILDVKEIIEVSEMTRVPMTPEYIRGVINLRGSVVSVIDLGARLGRPVSELSKRSCIVLVEVLAHNEHQLIGMLVDEVNEILEISSIDLQPAPDFGTDIRTDFIQGMGRVDDSFMILLDINNVLSVKELAALRGVAAAATAHDEAPGTAND